MFDTFDRTGKAEFPFPKQAVFRAVCYAIEGIHSMNIENRDDFACRLDVKTGISGFSWGEVVSISVLANGTDSAVVSIQSASKTIFGSATTHGKNRKNVREIINRTSRLLNQNGTQRKNEIESTLNTSEAISTNQSSILIADELMKLADLQDKNILSSEEFHQQKARLLSCVGGSIAAVKAANQEQPELNIEPTSTSGTIKELKDNSIKRNAKPEKKNETINFSIIDSYKSELSKLGFSLTGSEKKWAITQEKGSLIMYAYSMEKLKSNVESIIKQHSQQIKN